MNQLYIYICSHISSLLHFLIQLRIVFFFFFGSAKCGCLPRHRTCAPCSVSTEPQPRDRQGSPIANLRERGGTVKGGRAVVKPPTTWPRWTCGKSHPVLFPESSVTAAWAVHLSWEQIWPESLSAPCFQGLFPDSSQNGLPQTHYLHFSLPYLQTSQVAAPEVLPSPPCFVPTAPDCHCPCAWLHSRIRYR